MIILRVAFYTLGCKVNQYETNAIMEDFIKDGFEVVDSEDEADVYILNSCTVTASSDKKSRQILRRFRRLNNSAVIGLIGCFPQAFPNVAEALSEADVILGAANKNMLLPSVKSVLRGEGRIVDIKKYSRHEEFATTKVSSFGEKTRAFVKIQDGCERFCAYCIIPHARGPVRSKPLDDLKVELEALAKSGYKEVVLVGINLSCYGSERGEHLLDAIRLACRINGIERVRLGSLEPELLGSEAIAQMSAEKKLCPQFHLSLQSGSDGTLKRMRRHYNTAEYMEIVENLRSAFPGAAITTDIMVGFPGETPEEFEQSLNFARELGLAKAHVFAYSRRKGTVADRMEGQISQSEKVARSKQMIAVTDSSRKNFLNQQIGFIEEVLFETLTGNGWEGYTKNYTPVIVKTDADLAGKIRSVNITGADDTHCTGELI